MKYTCKTCGAIADEPKHLCNPCGDPKTCSFCGTPKLDAGHMCKGRLERMRYVCESCGRVAIEEWNLCVPQPIN